MQPHLRAALTKCRLRVVYQPIFNAQTLALEGAEALLRWDDPKLGPIGPAEFIPVAENCGLIEPIGDFVLDQVVVHVHSWREAGLSPVPVSVNVSPTELNQGDFVDRLRFVLERAELDGSLLQLEVTENALLDDFSAASENMSGAAKLGVRFAIDDFGTGYSSLRSLRYLPIQCLKIDREFVDGIDVDRRDRAVVGALVGMAHALGLTVVAEGVEREAELEVLRQLKCDQVQGFLTGAPVSGDAMCALLSAHPRTRIAR